MSRACVIPLLVATSLSASAPPGFTDIELAELVLRAEDTRQIAPLVERAGDPDAAVRARIALALARIGVPDGLDTALRLLEDPDPEVRRQAAFAVGRLEYDLAGSNESALRDRARAGLAQQLATDPASAPEAAWSLGQVGGSGATVAAAIAAIDPDADPRLSTFLLDAWWRTGAGEAAALRRYVQAENPGVRLAAANALRRGADESRLPILAPLLEDPDPEVRAMALRGLSGAPRGMVQEQGASLLGDADRRVQCAAAEWLRSDWASRPEEPPGDEVFAAVLRRSLDRNPMVRGCALSAMGAVVDTRAVAADRLLEALGDTEVAIHAVALEAFTTADPSLAERAWARYVAGRPLTAVIEPPIDWSLVLRLGRRAGVESDVALGARVRSGDERERAAALGLLFEADPASAEVVVRDLYGEGSGADPAAGLRGLLRLFRTGTWTPEPGLLEQVWRTYWDGRGGDVVALRTAALELLVAAAPEMLATRTSLLTSEPDRLLRFRWLRAMDPAVVEPERDADLLGASPTIDDPRALAERVMALQDHPARVVMETPRGTIVAELRADWAPRTAARFLELVEEGRLLDNRFHRVIPGFVAQGGGLERPPPPMPNEDSLLDYRAGRIGMALAGRDTGTSQFFITRADQPHLVGLYPVFGEVVEGQRVVDRLLPGDPVRISRER